MTTIRLVLLWLFIPLGMTVHAESNSSKSLNDAMKECASIKRDLKRLACFDALSGRASDFKIEAMTSQQQTKQQNIVVEQAQQQVESVTALPQTPESSFGLKETTRPDDDIDVITSYIPGEFSGWQKDDQITLANGQIWQITDGRIFHKATNPRVEISRGLFGSFSMKIVGLNRSSKVKRIQ
jgi:hypothetical protein